MPGDVSTRLPWKKYEVADGRLCGLTYWQVYTGTVEILGLNPADACMVAAHNGDLTAARLCGPTTAFIIRPTEHGPAQTSDLHAEQAWDFAATDLNDLVTQLGCAT
jgi:2-haloacid dehalogenase